MWLTWRCAKPLKPFRGKIKTQEEYEEPLPTFSLLMDKGETLGEEEADYMDLLGTLLEDCLAHPPQHGTREFYI